MTSGLTGAICAFAVTNAVKNTAANIGTKSEKIVFADLPESLEAFNGLCSAIILPDGRKGRIVVTVESEGLRKARQIIRVR